MVQGRQISIGQLFARIVFRDDSGRGLSSASAGLSRFETRIDGARRALSTMSDRLGQASVRAGLFGAALTAFGGVAVREFGRAEDGIARLRGQVGLTDEQVDAMLPTVRAVGAEFGLTEAAALDALFPIASAGQRGGQALDTLRVAAQGAASQMGDIQELSQLLISGTAAWSSTNLTAAQLMDELTAAVRVGNFQARDLATAFTRVASTFATAGVATSDLLAAFAVMSRVQPNLQRNATGLEGLFAVLIRPTTDLASALAQVGIDASTLSQRLVDDGLVETVFAISDAFEGNRIALTQAFASNREALNGFNNLVAAGREVASVVRNEIVDSVGAADLTFQSFEGTVNLVTQQRLAAMRNAMAELGSSIAPLFTRAAEALTEVLSVFASELEGGNRLLQGLVLVLGVGGPALLGFAAAAKVVSVAFGVMSVAAGVFNAALTALSLNPWGFAIAAIIAGVALLVIYWDEIVALLRDAWNLIRGIGSSIGSLFGFGGANQNSTSTSAVDRLPRFQTGGLVPGPMGAPVLAVVHGGEFVVPAPTNAASITNASAPTGGATINGDINISIDGRGQDARAIAEAVRDHLQSEILAASTASRSGVDT